VWTVDACLEGTHFRRSTLSLEDVGYRSFQAAASDLAAMGARPLAALSALTLPRGFSRRELGALARGQAKAARECGAAIVGGNLASGRELGVTTTLVGAAAHPLTRAGAVPGDELWLVGDVGLAALGLELLQASPGRARRGHEAACVAAWRRPRALITEGLRLVGRAHAAIDVSDGLAGDVAHLARASAVRVVIDEAALTAALRPELCELAERRRRTALSFAIHGGEDYALVAAGPGARRPRFAKRIGHVERGRGVFLRRGSGALVRSGEGFDHLREPRSGRVARGSR
jgi:thiamine-monophosphate kinase